MLYELWLGACPKARKALAKVSPSAPPSADSTRLRISHAVNCPQFIPLPIPNLPIP